MLAQYFKMRTILDILFRGLKLPKKALSAAVCSM